MLDYDDEKFDIVCSKLRNVIDDIEIYVQEKLDTKQQVSAEIYDDLVYNMVHKEYWEMNLTNNKLSSYTHTVIFELCFRMNFVYRFYDNMLIVTNCGETLRRLADDNCKYSV